MSGDRLEKIRDAHRGFARVYETVGKTTVFVARCSCKRWESNACYSMSEAFDEHIAHVREKEAEADGPPAAQETINGELK